MERTRGEFGRRSLTLTHSRPQQRSTSGERQGGNRSNAAQPFLSLERELSPIQDRRSSGLPAYHAQRERRLPHRHRSPPMGFSNVARNITSSDALSANVRSCSSKLVRPAGPNLSVRSAS